MDIYERFTQLLFKLQNLMLHLIIYILAYDLSIFSFLLFSFIFSACADCRICVWNAVDGSLVHSLTGHSESVSIV